MLNVVAHLNLIFEEPPCFLNRDINTTGTGEKLAPGILQNPGVAG